MNYTNIAIDTWIGRGKNNTMAKYDYVEKEYNLKGELVDANPPDIMPWWFGWDRVHQSHRASLLRKDPVFYGNKGISFQVEKFYMERGYLWPSYHDPSVRE